jgi:hypothetical protein
MQLKNKIRYDLNICWLGVGLVGLGFWYWDISPAVVLVLLLTFLAGSRGLSDLVLRKILLIITELAINTSASPLNNSPSIIYRRRVNYGVRFHVKIPADIHIK